MNNEQNSFEFLHALLQIIAPREKKFDNLTVTSNFFIVEIFRW